MKQSFKNWSFIGHWSLVIGISTVLLGSAAFYVFNNQLGDKTPAAAAPPSFSALPTEDIITSPKPADLIEQPLDSPDESFSVTATKLDLDNNIYQLAFTLSNTSDQDKDFYLIPVSQPDQARFQGIRGSLAGGQASWNFDSGWNFDQAKHKQELIPELAKAYDDIDNNGYTGQPIKLTLDSQTTLTAQSEWGILSLPLTKGEREGVSGLQPVYFLVYGSAGGAVDSLDILNIYSHPLEGDDWEVYFTTQGQDDLTITPADQNTIDHMDFTYLGCSPSATNLEEALVAADYQEMPPQILANDVIYYSDWSCPGVGKLVHRVNVGGKHDLKFEFGGETEYAHNANLYWVGGAGDSVNTNANDWSTTNPASCNDGGGDASAVPGASDVAIFDADCDSSAVISSNWSVAGININAGYAGTITQNNSVTLTVGTSDFIQADGTFTGGDSTITFNDAVTISGGTFNHNSGTIVVGSSSSKVWDVNTSLTVNNFTISAGYLSITTGETIVVNGTTTLTNGYFSGSSSYTGTLNAKGPVSVADTFDGNAASTAGVFLIDGAGDQSFTIPNGAKLPFITLNNSLTTINFDAGATATFTNNFTLQAGTFTASSGTTQFSGYVTISGGTFNHNSGTIEVTGGSASGKVWDVNTSLTVNNFTMSAGYLSITTGETIVVNGTTTLTNGYFSGSSSYTGTLNAKGPVSVADTFDGNAATTAGVFLIDGAGDQSFTIPNGAKLPFITLNNSLTTINFDAGATATFTDNFTLQAGTLIASSGTTQFQENVTISGGTFTASSGTIEVTGVTATWDVNNSLTVNNFTVSKSAGAYDLDIGTGDTIIINGTTTLTDGDIDVGILEFRGDVTVGSLFDGGTAAFKFTGSNTQTFDLTGGEATVDNDISVNKSGGQVNLISTLTMDTTNQDLIIEEGVFNINGNTLTVSGTGKTFILESGGNLQLQGGESVTTPTTISSGSIVTYIGADAAVTVNDWSYKTLTFNAAGKQFNWTASTTYTVAENFKVYGTFGNNVVFRSTASPTTWGINNTGATEYVRYADVQDSVATEEIIVVGGKNSGNNTNWTWLGNVPMTIKGGNLRFKGNMTIK